MYHYEKQELWMRKTMGRPFNGDLCGEYPYTARSNTSLRPKKAMGDLFAICLKTGYRNWAFRTVAARDKFVDTYGATRVMTDYEKRQLGLLPAR